jgi:hypothetical protein
MARLRTGIGFQLKAEGPTDPVGRTIGQGGDPLGWIIMVWRWRFRQFDKTWAFGRSHNE